MFVLPRINGDDTISLFIVPYVIDVVGQVTGPEGITAPILSQQIIGPISRRIKNGETMVIAGLATKNDSSSSSKVPLFGDLPLIGQLFRSRDVRVNDTELLVFVTPTILKETTGGATGGGPANVGGLSITP
jgi:type II secretory pathway component GspD/PulD (secretin)